MIKSFLYNHLGKEYVLGSFDHNRVKTQLVQHAPVNTNGLVLYPMPADPTEGEIKFQKKHRIPATVIRDGGTECLRWYWQVCPHKKNHYNCTPLGDGLCATKVVRYWNWNRESNTWELEPKVNAADPAQEQVLDSK